MEIARRLALVLAAISIAGLAWVVLNGRGSSITAQIALGTALTVLPAMLQLSLGNRITLIWVQLAGLSIWWEPGRDIETIFASTIIPAVLFRTLWWIITGATQNKK